MIPISPTNSRIQPSYSLWRTFRLLVEVKGPSICYLLLYSTMGFSGCSISFISLLSCVLKSPFLNLVRAAKSRTGVGFKGMFPPQISFAWARFCFSRSLFFCFRIWLSVFAVLELPPVLELDGLELFPVLDCFEPGLFRWSRFLAISFHSAISSW